MFLQSLCIVYIPYSKAGKREVVHVLNKNVVVLTLLRSSLIIVLPYFSLFLICFLFFFCIIRIGVLGTRGRLCNSTSYGIDGCRLLCCGRGYQTVIRDVEEKCHCKFVWCCRVQCEMCSFMREEHYCNWSDTQKNATLSE